MTPPDAIADAIGGLSLVPVEGGQSGARIWRVADGNLFLKHGADHHAALVSDEIARLRWLAGRLPAPPVVATHEKDGAAWLLTAELPGMTAGAYLKRHRDRYRAVAGAMADLLRAFQELPTGECPFDSSVAAWLPVARGLVDADRVDTDDFDEEHAGWSARRVLGKVQALAHAAAGSVVIHGDFSLGNIMLDDDGAVTGVIDVGRLGVGDPYRDIFIGWRDLSGFGAAAQRAFLDALGIEGLEETRRDLHRALDELF